MCQTRIWCPVSRAPVRRGLRKRVCQHYDVAVVLVRNQKSSLFMSNGSTSSEAARLAASVEECEYGSITEAYMR